jgi:hypothetical protein
MNGFVINELYMINDSVYEFIGVTPPRNTAYPFGAFIFRSIKNGMTVVASDDKSYPGVLVPWGNIRKLSEKEFLEIQLKESQKTLDEVSDKIISIKQKISDLDSPKIGKMYEVHDVRHGKYAIGVLVSIKNGMYEMVNYIKNCKVIVTHSYDAENNDLIPMDASTDKIAQSIIEFIKLGELK